MDKVPAVDVARVSLVGLLWSGSALAGGVVLLLVTTEDNLPVILPTLTAASIAALCFRMLRRCQRGASPAFDVGMVYVAVVALYTLYPLIGFMINGLKYTEFSDARLFAAQPSPIEIATVGWYHVVHLVSFAVMYLIVRWRTGAGTPQPDRLLSIQSGWPDSTSIVVIVACYAVISLFFLFLGHFFDLAAGSYSESYLVHTRLPLVLAQLANHLGGARLTLELAVLAVMFRSYRKWRLLIAGWLAVMVLITFARLWSRTELVLFGAAVAIMYHFLVRPISVFVVGLAGATGLVFVTLQGLLRMGVPFSELSLSFNPFAYASEFEVVFANAFDVGRLRELGKVGELRATFYLSDLINLVPQQLLPFEKTVPSAWYVNTFYPEYAATGGGLAFGTISESVLGAGWIDLAGRGALLGVVLGLVHRHCTRRGTFWVFVAYVWVTVLVYQLYRGSTLSLLPLFVFRFLPVVAVVKILSALLSLIVKVTHDAGHIRRGIVS